MKQVFFSALLAISTLAHGESLTKGQVLKHSQLKFVQVQNLVSLGGVDAGGGDFIRATFLQGSEKIQIYLKETEEGQKLCREQGVAVEKLQAVSKIDQILVIPDAIVDRTGSLVDAAVKDGVLYLNDERWTEILTQQRSVQHLIFHELLRLAGYDDDNYVISKNLKNLPDKYQVYVPGLHLKEVSDDLSLKSVLVMANPVFGGNGCVDNGNTQIDLNSSNNTVTIYSNDYTALVGPASGEKRLDRKSCNLAIPNQIAAGHRLRITQVDLKGEALGDSQGQVRVEAEVFWAGGRGPRFSLTPKIGKGAFLEREAIDFVSSCGDQDFNLRFNSSITALTPDAKTKDVSIRLSSVKLYFKVEKCQN